MVTPHIQDGTSEDLFAQSPGSKRHANYLSSTAIFVSDGHLQRQLQSAKDSQARLW
jgi:hypothetical protein